MATYDFWLGGFYASSFVGLLEDVGLLVPASEWMRAELVPTGTAYYWPRLEVS